MRVRVSAPGKSILMGEHAAVYHRPALVAAVDRRTTAVVEEVPGRSVRLDLPLVGVVTEVTWDDLRRYTDERREAWLAYERDPDPALFAAVRGDDPAHLVKIALGEAAARLDAPPSGMSLRLDSEIPVGAGFGSSAAAAVAVVEAVLALHGVRLDPAALHRLTLDVERRQHGLPSGVDNATVIYGGLLWAKKLEDGGFELEPLDVRPVALDGFHVYHTGAPAEPTGAVVAAVRRRLEVEPERYEPVIDRMETLTTTLRRELQGATTRSGRVIELVRGFEACLEEIGVVPERIRDVVRRIESQGAAAKVSGAGALSGPGAGALLVYDPGGRLTGHALAGLEPLDLGLGAEGVRRE